MKVPLSDLSGQFEAIRDEILTEISRLCEEQAFILGGRVEALEKNLADFHSVSHAVGVASGTDALLLSLKALEVGPGDEVITTPFSFIATVEAVMHLGARPIFVDIDPETFNLNSQRVDEALTPRVKVLLPVHLFGQCCDMKPLLDLARDEDLRLLEDAAQAIGAKQNGRPVGTTGDAACLSFYPAKILGGMGEGGMVLTNHPEIAERVRLLRVHGSRDAYLHEAIGFNSRLDALQAAILLVKFKHLNQWIRMRRQCALNYQKLFEEAGLLESLRPPVERPGNEHVYNYYVVRASRRDELKDFLAQAGVASRVYYPVPLHLQPCLRELGYRQGDFPAAEQACQEVLALPMYPELSLERQTYVVDKIKAFYELKP